MDLDRATGGLERLDVRGELVDSGAGPVDGRMLDLTGPSQMVGRLAEADPEGVEVGSGLADLELLPAGVGDPRDLAAPSARSTPHELGEQGGYAGVVGWRGQRFLRGCPERGSNPHSLVGRGF